MGHLAQNSSSRKSNTTSYHLFYKMFFVLKNFSHNTINIEYMHSFKTQYATEIGSINMFLLNIFIKPTFIFKPFMQQRHAVWCYDNIAS